MTETYMAHPTAVLKAYMQAHQIERDLSWGQLAMGLEVVTLIRTLEDIPVVNEAEKEGTIACLVTLLREQQLEEVYGFYDALAEWRKPRFVSEPAVGARDSGASLPHASRDQAPSRPGTADAQPLERRGQVQGSSPTHEQLALPVAGQRERHCA